MSCLLHGGLFFAALLFLQRIQLAPQAEPFKWNVAMATASAPETSTSRAPVQTAPAPALQRSSPPAPAARPVMEPAHPRVETQAILPPTPASPVIEKPAPVPTAPVAPPPSAEPAPKPPVLSKPEPIGKQPDPVMPMPPPVATSSQHAPITSALQSIDTHVATPPQEPTSASSAVPSPAFEPPPPHPSETPAEPTPPAQSGSATTSTEVQANQQRGSAPGSQVAALAQTGQSKAAKVDYGWLSELMAKWIEDLDKRYPAMLRTEGIQGKVTLTAVLHEDGVLSDVRVVKSSGNETLDQVAVEDVRKGPPINLSRPLERPSMPVKFSIIYDLKTAR